jgi:sugar lactone lactonase YvrE
VDSIEIETVVDARMGLGECPIWSVAEQALYWIDIPDMALHRLDRSGHHRHWSLPSHPGSTALYPDGQLLLALRSGLHRFDPRTERLTLLVQPFYEPQHERFNDGRTDRQGRFIVGTIAERGAGYAASLARYTPASNALDILPVNDLRISNGLAFSPDGRRMYLCDTPSRQIWQFDYDPETGTPSKRRTFISLEPEHGRPDGAAVDSDGCYWSALIGALGRFTPEGKLDRLIRIPAGRVTMLAFGGAQLDTLFITTAGHEHTPPDIAHEPLAGRLLAIRPGVKGLPEPSLAV